MDAEINSIGKLRRDAIKRGMQELAIAYGWSEIRMKEEKLERKMTQIEPLKGA